MSLLRLFLVSETLRKEKVKPAEQQTNIKSGNTSSLLPPKIQIAYQEFSSRLTFEIEKIDSVLKLTAGESVCIEQLMKNIPTYSLQGYASVL
jgi:hypothetical protein